MSKRIVLFDEHSRNVVQINSSELVANDIAIISTLSEINRIPDASQVVILEPYLLGSTANFEMLEVYKALFDLEYIFVGQDITITSICSTMGRVCRIPYLTIDYSFLQMAFYGDFEEDRSVTPTGLLDLITSSNIGKEDKEYIQKVLEMVNSVVEYSKRLSYESKYLRLNNEALSETIKSVMQSVRKQIKSAEVAERIIKQFEISYVNDVYSELKGSYTEKPFVLYLKEYQELCGMEFLLETLMSLFKLNVHVLPKVIRLGDSNSCRMLQRLPPYYHRLQDSFLQKDVLDNDFLVKTGNNSVTLNYLLTNQEKLGALIIVDCRDYFGKALDDPLIDQYFSLCRDSSNISSFGLDPYRTITNDVHSKLPWNIDEEELVRLNSTDRFLKLVNTETIGKIYQMYKELSVVV